MEDARRKSLFDMPLVTRPLKSGSAARENIILPERFVFLPLQVHDDSQILLYSPHFPDMPSVVRFCAEGIEACNRRNAAQLRLVVKEHPSDHGRIDYSDVFHSFPDVVFTKLMSTQILIEKSTAVITVNSTVGIEAMLRLKPVITLGDAFYAVPGLVRPCRGDDLAGILEVSLATPVDRDLVEHFLYFLRYDYLVPLDRNNLASFDPAPAVAKIMKALP
jgi:capsular polysaccharide export protein